MSSVTLCHLKASSDAVCDRHNFFVIIHTSSPTPVLICSQLHSTVQTVDADAMMGFHIKIHTMQLVLAELTLNN